MRLKDAAEEWGEEEAWIQMKEDDDVAKAGNDSEEVIRQDVEEIEDGLKPEEVAEEAEEGRKIVRKKSPITVTKECWDVCWLFRTIYTSNKFCNATTPRLRCQSGSAADVCDSLDEVSSKHCQNCSK